MRCNDDARRDVLVSLAAKAAAVLPQLATAHACKDGRSLHLYRAGLQDGQVRFGLFGRDLLITARLLRNPRFTQDVLYFVAETLGVRTDARSGEEPGRGLHERDRIEMRGRLTRYNALDVTPLFLVTLGEYVDASGDEAILADLDSAIERAIGFMVAHLANGRFVEDPSFAEADGYALRATYWKDSRLPEREDPCYPVAYGLVQAQAVAALRAADGLLGKWQRLAERCPGNLATLATDALDELTRHMWDRKHNLPLIALDGCGRIEGVSSDMLHMLDFLEPGDLDAAKLVAIARAARSLVTPYGIRSFAPGQTDYDSHSYHLGAVWPFEQAIIFRGARAHGLTTVCEAALGVIQALEAEGFPELVYWDGGVLEGARAVPEQGCDLQLWTLAVPSALLAAGVAEGA